MVDAKHVLAHLDEVKEGGAENESREQIAFADKVLLNKVDLVDGATLAEVRRRIAALNPAAPIVECVRSEVDIAQLLDIRAFDLDRVLAFDPSFLLEEEAAAGGGHACTDAHCTDHDHDHGHGHGDHEHAHEHGHGHEAAAAEGAAGAAAGGDGAATEPAKKKPHVHDTSISSVGLVEPGELDMAKVNGWLGALLRDRGADIYRMKGVLAIKDAPAKFVFQGVHMQFDGAPHTAWEEGEARVSKLIFIGKKLDREELTAAFRACLVVPAQGGGAAGESKSSS